MFVVMDVLQSLLFSITFITTSYSCDSQIKNPTWFLYLDSMYNIYNIYVKDSISLYPSPLHTQSPGQKGSPRLRHFGFVLQWETSLTLPGRRTNTVTVTTTTATSSRLRMPTMIFFFFLQSWISRGWMSKMSVWQSWYTPTITPQSGSRLSLCCLTMPCLTSCSGVMGWKTEDRGSHSMPSSLTTTIVLHSGTALSTSAYFPLSENTWANLRKGEERWDVGGGHPDLELFVLHWPMSTL